MCTRPRINSNIHIFCNTIAVKCMSRHSFSASATVVALLLLPKYIVHSQYCTYFFSCVDHQNNILCAVNSTPILFRAFFVIQFGACISTFSLFVLLMLLFDAVKGVFFQRPVFISKKSEKCALNMCPIAAFPVIFYWTCMEICKVVILQISIA